MEDTTGYPINYDHYYTDTIKSRRQSRQRAALTETVKQASKTTLLPDHQVDQPDFTTTIDIEKVVRSRTENTDHNIETFSCEEALDCLLAIYKERHFKRAFLALPVYPIIMILVLTWEGGPYNTGSSITAHIE
jgi:hypothetical protein